MENVHTMQNFTKDELDKKIKEISNIIYKRNLVYGDGNASTKIVNILKGLETIDTSKVISYINK